jgi:ubiquitin carboxyl-terminal hydrolase 8
MEEFVLPRPSPQEAQEIVRNYGEEAIQTDISLTPPYIYDAYAVVRHLGDTTRSGHYTSAIKDRARGCWRYFNDTRYQDFQPETMSPAQALDNDQAYFIFYQRRSVPEQNGK